MVDDVLQNSLVPLLLPFLLFIFFALIGLFFWAFSSKKPNSPNIITWFVLFWRFAYLFAAGDQRVNVLKFLLLAGVAA